MSSKFVLLIDLDGVVFDWYGAVTNRLKYLDPDVEIIPEDDVEDFYVENTYPGHVNILKSVMAAPGLYSNLDPVPGAVEALKDIEENLQDVISPVLCTAPWLDYHEQMCFSEKAQSVEKHLGRYWLEKLLITKDKTVVRGHILIDDKPNIKGIMDPTWKHLVYDRGWNRHLDMHRFTWADWPDLRAGILENLSKVQ